MNIKRKLTQKKGRNCLKGNADTILYVIPVEVTTVQVYLAKVHLTMSSNFSCS